MTNPAPSTATMSIRPDEYDFISNLLKERSGLALTKDKMYLIESRLLPIARIHGCAGLSGLIDLLRTKKPPAVIHEVIEAMTTNESSFFRDGKPFEVLRKELLPYFKQLRGGVNSLRIWSAACSTGQEPYSTAISLLEESANMPGWRYEIVATDLAEKVLEKAKNGLYSQFEAQRGLGIQQLIKYFQPQPDSCWKVNDQLRSMVSFRAQNLLEDYTSLGKFDIIFCRNVLIYFDERTKTNVLNKLARSLSQGGALILGSTESMGVGVNFKYTEKSRGIYVLE